MGLESSYLKNEMVKRHIIYKRESSLIQKTLYILNSLLYYGGLRNNTVE